MTLTDWRHRRGAASVLASFWTAIGFIQLCIRLFRICCRSRRRRWLRAVWTIESINWHLSLPLVLTSSASRIKEHLLFSWLSRPMSTWTIALAAIMDIRSSAKIRGLNQKWQSDSGNSPTIFILIDAAGAAGISNWGGECWMTEQNKTALTYKTTWGQPNNLWATPRKEVFTHCSNRLLLLLLLPVWCNASLCKAV